MARNASFGSLMRSIAQESARQQRQAAATERKNIQLARKMVREHERQQVQLAKEEKQRYIEDRMAEVDDMNQDLADTVTEFTTLLDESLSTHSKLDFDSLMSHEIFPEFQLSPELRTSPPAPNKNDFFKDIKKPSVFTAWIPNVKSNYSKAIDKAENAFQKAQQSYPQILATYQEKIAAFQASHALNKAKFEEDQRKKNEEIQEFKNAYLISDPDAIIAYASMVLEKSSYPNDFPQNFRVTFSESSKELVVEYQLPAPSIVPTVSEHKYVKSKDAIDQKSRKIAEIKSLYQEIVSAIALRTIHEIVESDYVNNIQVISFNGYIETIDPATGADIKPFLISVRSTKESFESINLSKIDKLVCLRNLGATVSPRPYELQPVKPIVEFDMVDKRFVEQDDILSTIDSRPNLYELNPFEFEALVSNLFQKIGLETKLTRSSKDGGVDVVAFDMRPVLGGKVIIQAKRYKNVVGVSAVRDLYGTMMNEGASKGILVTTSGYGPDAFEFSKDKPIELLDGGKLLYLLQQAGIEAKIVLPSE